MKVLSGSTDRVVRGALGPSGELAGFLWAFIPLVSQGPQSDEKSGVLLNTCRLKPIAVPAELAGMNEPVRPWFSRFPLAQ